MHDLDQPAIKSVMNESKVQRLKTTTYSIKVTNLTLTQIFPYSYMAVTGLDVYWAITVFLEATDRAEWLFPSQTNVQAVVFVL